MSSLYSQFLQLGYRISMYTILLRLSTVLLITHNSALKNFTKQARRSLKLKRKKIFAEVLQHAIAAAAALDSSCSQSHHAIKKKFAFVINRNDVHTYIVCSDGIKRSREPTRPARQAGNRLQNSLIPLRINEKIDPYVHSGLCVRIHHDVHTYFVVVVWL